MDASIASLKSIGIFLWAHHKIRVEKTPVENLDELKTRIINEIELIKNTTCHDVFLETVKRLNFPY